ncbi:MAG TPA: hypothetical protein VJS30_11335 [Paraburkholderia sp.]|nr:hypothetical protein [Paraburkholderia sp.]
MNNKHTESNEIPLFPRNSNLLYVDNKREQTLYRYLGEYDDQVHLVELGIVRDGILSLHRGPSSKKRRKSRSIADIRRLVARERLRRVEERGIPPQMADYRPSDEQEEEQLKERGAVVAYIERVYGDSPFLQPRVYRDAIENASEVHSVSPNTAIKYYERHLTYAGHKYALVDQDWLKGAPGEERHGRRGPDGALIESGRKTDAQRLNPLSKLKRMLFPEYLRERLRNFVARHAHEPGATATKLTRKFLSTLRGFNRTEDGSVQSFPLNPNNLPSEPSTLKICTELFRNEKAKFESLKASEKGKGYSAQLARGDLSVLDIDGTVADCMLCYGATPIQIDGVLKPTVLVGIERASRAIVGWCVTYRHENADSYVQCIYSACTDKEAELKRWGVSHLDGFVFGSPSAIFVDRGPGISEKVQMAVVKGLRKRLLMASPGSPQSKGDVEQFMGFFQDEILNLPGVTHGEAVRGTKKEKEAIRRRNREKLRNAPKIAQLTVEQFMKAFLTAISRYNLTADVRRLRNALMLEANVPPVPKQLFLFNQAFAAGDAAWMLTEEQVIRRLAKPFDGVAPKGVVTIRGKQFSSRELRMAAAEYEVYNPGKSMPVSGFELFTSELKAVWDYSGRFEELTAEPLTEERFGLGFPDIFDYIEMRGTGDLAEQRRKHRRHETPEQAGRKGQVSKSTQRKMEAAEGTKRTVNNRALRSVAVAQTGADDTSVLMERLQEGRGKRPEVADVVEAGQAQSSSGGNYQNISIDF